MRRVISIFLTLFFVFITCPVQAEEEVTLKVTYNAENAAIVLSGYVEGYAMVTIVPSVFDENGEDISLDVINADNPPKLMEQINRNGSFSGYEVLLPESLSSGKYTVYLHGDSAVAADYFSHMNFEDAKEVLADLKEYKDNSNYVEYKNTAILNAVTLGVDTTDAGYVQNKDKIFELLYKFCSEYVNPSAFNTFYYKMYALAGVENSEREEIEELLEKWSGNLSIDYDADYLKDERLNEKSKDELCASLSEINYSEEFEKRNNTDFKVLFEELKSVAVISSATTWSDVRKAVCEDFENLSYLVNKEEYKNLSDKNDVFSKMKDYSFETFVDIEKAFLAACKEVKDFESRPSLGGVSGGTGASGGGGGTPVVFTPPVVEEKFPFEFKINFSDFDEEHWAYDSVYNLASKGIIGGYPDNTFKPEGAITRAEFVKIIVSSANEFGIPLDGDKEISFSDVNEGDWYYEYVNLGASAGIINGDNGSFSPSLPIKREDAAVIIYRYLTAKHSISGIKIFDDRRDISSYAKDAVSSLATVNIISGMGDNMFMPQKNITRAQAAQLINNALEYVLYAMEGQK